MKRILIHSTLALTLAATAAFAQQTAPAPTDSQNTTTQQQPAGHHGKRHAFDPHKAAAHMGKKLGLNADQTAKVEPILSDSQQKMSALRANTSLTQDQRHEQMKAIHQDTQTQLATVLTPDQMQQLKAMRHGPRGGRHQGQPQSPDAGAPPSA